ncbi:UNVERIFIED_ORG: deoxyribodipyrimidine photo-lyase [Rhizobium esperanzae]|uniref:cryptochrome/photolyase family protein n=1 Tax=Rhizobium phaseoli TaxID=396 RepID=UPI0004D55885|nr:deoxyribodipyrimidine photo-lyase [Rhizobium phaseoli]KEC75348.1 deoxyribodipyrimidine photo-lyase [Rhizobium leguminosarum bv. phaseoli CCGM1]PWI54771.1 deoxyribodipyrimidine photo-lyase [Rhizobium phaseoli]
MAKDAAKPVILWFRKDLRLGDNKALNAAHFSGRPIICLYIREPEAAGTGPLGAAQAWWLHHSLEALDGSLRKRRGGLLLASGEALEVLRSLIRQSDADAVFWNRRYDPTGISIDARIEHELEKQAIEVKSFGGQLLHEPSQLMTGSGTPYRVYTPFWRALESSIEPEPLDIPSKLQLASKLPGSEKLESWKLLSTQPDWASNFADLWTPGEEGAQEKLRTFIEDRLDGYKENRDYPAKPATSMLSPHLALGEISPARIWDATRGLSKHVPAADIVHFRKEITWREFSYHLLAHFPRLATANWDDRFDGFEWGSAEEDFKAWSRGMTGYPIVDAGMRQLWRYGWMHNRVRMIAASFLIKDLMVDWRHGEAWFRNTLVDADPANNAASWQWVAGSGADASPFFRIFNPVLQGEKFDPDGDFVRAHVPELRKLDAKYIHRPFEAPKSVLDAADVILGETYPEPVVDHAGARRRALAAYNAIRGAA